MSAQQIMGWSFLLACVAVVIVAGFRIVRDQPRSEGAATTLNRACQTCGHLWDHPGHARVAPTYDPDDGGVIVCRVQGCNCFHTWFRQDKPARNLPDDPEVVAIRQRFQGMSKSEIDPAD